MQIHSWTAKFHKRSVTRMALAGVFMSLLACSQETATGAVDGAARGAVGGALASGFASLIFGGDPLDAAAQGAVAGAAIGGVAGAAQGSQRAAANQSAEENLRQAVGPDAYAGLEALVRCDYGSARSRAQAAQGSSNATFSLSGLWLEAAILTDQRNEAAARDLYPAIVARDPKVSSSNEAEVGLRDLQADIRSARQSDGLPTVCSF